MDSGDIVIRRVTFVQQFMAIRTIGFAYRLSMLYRPYIAELIGMRLALITFRARCLITPSTCKMGQESVNPGIRPAPITNTPPRKIVRIGGVTGWLRASAVAAAYGVPVSTHLYPDVAAARHASNVNHA